MGQNVEVGGRSGERHEDGGLSEIRFDGLQTGDVIFLETIFGDTYTLTVTRDEAQDMPVVSVEQHIGDEEAAMAGKVPGTLFGLRGSCDKIDFPVRYAAPVYTTDNIEEGHFVTGKSAYLLDATEATDCVLTDPIEKISLISAA
jgi:hypothetical protein